MLTVGSKPRELQREGVEVVFSSQGERVCCAVFGSRCMLTVCLMSVTLCMCIASCTCPCRVRTLYGVICFVIYFPHDYCASIIYQDLLLEQLAELKINKKTEDEASPRIFMALLFQMIS